MALKNTFMLFFMVLIPSPNKLTALAELGTAFYVRGPV
jgi:hypothetical protein